MTDTTTDARAKLDSAIHAAGIAMTCERIAERTTFRDAWKGSDGFHYRCKLYNDGLPGTSGSFYQCEYSVGRGIIRRWAKDHADLVLKGHKFGDGWDALCLKAMSAQGTRESLMEEALLNTVAARIFRPDIVDVVWSLLMDASGMSPHETLREWCKRMSDDFGMTWTNPVDAIEQYEDARIALGFLDRAFGGNLQTVTETAGEM